MSHVSHVNELLIASVSPQNLLRGVLWFKENEMALKRARHKNPWWRENTFVVEEGATLKPSEFLRRLADFGYERVTGVKSRGAFAVRGGVIELWPINTESPYLVEFLGNVVETIRAREVAIEKNVRLKSVDRDIEHLAPGSFVVHRDHGIGIFRGIVAKNLAHSSDIEIGRKSEIQNSNVFTGDFEFRAPDSEFSTTKNFEKFFIIEYAPPRSGGTPDMLYVPLAQKEKLTPYIGFTTPTIHRLGGSLWKNTTRRIREDALKLAEELVALYQSRARVTRPPYRGDPILEEALAHSFEHEETEGQQKAIKEIIKDLESHRPMERLLAGDVGFGKTEIALRAALRVIASGRQTALIAPTTILASQHEKVFRDRLKHLPIKIAMLSRLTPPKEAARVVKELADGKIECVIGTHRLFSRDVTFKNLGLIIIDEEQRFGVRHKEYFKNLSRAIDILSLSATPIPRTMQLVVSKLRDISVIETPPRDRHPITTLVLPWSGRTIKKAIYYELDRGGQVYVLHNRIETMGHARETLKKILKTEGRPLPAVEIVHGKMSERDLIRIMGDFREKKIDILIATTIIENGLDISNANTLIVDDVTRLGLAQAHQLRGRIGRGKIRAFAYFLYHPRRLTAEATDRLEALLSFTNLGTGFQIALRDLELRGAGNVFGREQSGAINSVGLNLYCQILNEAVEAMEQSS